STAPPTPGPRPPPARASGSRRFSMVDPAGRLPVLAAVPLGPAPPLGDELERHPPDPDLVAPTGPRLLQAALHPGAGQPALQLGHLPLVVQIGLGHPAFDPRPRHPEPLPLPPYREGLAAGADHDVGR